MRAHIACLCEQTYEADMLSQYGSASLKGQKHQCAVSDDEEQHDGVKPHLSLSPMHIYFLFSPIAFYGDIVRCKNEHADL